MLSTGAEYNSNCRILRRELIYIKNLIEATTDEKISVTLNIDN